MRKLIAFVFASVLLGAGLYLLFLQLFVSPRLMGSPSMRWRTYQRPAAIDEDLEERRVALILGPFLCRTG